MPQKITRRPGRTMEQVTRITYTQRHSTPAEIVADALRAIANQIGGNQTRRGSAPITRDDLQDILLQLAEKLEA